MDQDSESWHLDAVVGADKVLINRLEPANIVVRVRHEVNVELPLHDAAAGVVADEASPSGSGEREQQQVGAKKRRRRHRQRHHSLLDRLRMRGGSKHSLTCI